MDLSVDLSSSVPTQQPTPPAEVSNSTETAKDAPMDLSEGSDPKETTTELMEVDKTDVSPMDTIENMLPLQVHDESLPKQQEDSVASVVDALAEKAIKEESSKSPSFLASLFPVTPVLPSSTTAGTEAGPTSASQVRDQTSRIDEFDSKKTPTEMPSTTKSEPSIVSKTETTKVPSPEPAARRISPRLQSTSEAGGEDMSCETDRQSQSSVSKSPKQATVPKTGGKQLPIAGKTIRQRKSSTASPNNVEPKKPRNKRSSSPNGKAKKKPPAMTDDVQDGRNDFYCWICHKEGEVLCCELCPRVFHATCLNMTEEPEGDWFCPECETITNAECKETQSKAMSALTLEQFSLLLRHVIQRMKIPVSEPFHDPVDTAMFPDYRDYVFHPMDLSTIEKNVRKKKYGCPEAFTSEFKWIIHNCVIYNGLNSKLTQTARSMLKIAEGELGEIEVCPECYLNSCKKRENWFCEPCKEIHPLVWAKLQGFPHWPGKALRIEKGMVDVRFFGQHDRAWIPMSGCYLISKELPLTVKTKKKNKGAVLKGPLDGATQEMQVYIENVRKVTGEFEYAPPRTLLTHIDLYGKSGRGSKSTGQSEVKIAPTMIDSTSTDAKVKAESKVIGMGKDMAKSRVLDSLPSKKSKTVTTSGEHPSRLFATKKKKASMQLLSKTIESCKASCGIDKLQDIKINLTPEETTSSSSEDDSFEGKGKTAGELEQDDAEKPSTSKAAEDDDSDAELVIDLGDMDDGTDARSDKKSKDASSKLMPSILKKHKVDLNSEKSNSQKSPLKSILLGSAKAPETDERKKMLAKALSEKIGGKRKFDQDSSGTSGAKVRKTQEFQASQTETMSKLTKTKEKEWKKTSSLVKDTGAKSKLGILKNAGDAASMPRKESNPDRRLSDQYKHKPKDTPYKSILKKQSQQDKHGRIVQMPTEADTRKLFNGGRIPRKNPSSNTNEEEQEKRDDFHQPADSGLGNSFRNRAIDNHDSNPRPNHNMQYGNHKQSELQPWKDAVSEDIARTSLKKYSDKVMETVQKVFYEMYTDMMVPLTINGDSETGTPAAGPGMHEIAQLRVELQRLKWMHDQEIAELKHNHDLAVNEIRQSLEFEKKQMLLEAKTQADAEKQRAVDETKRKQWCAYCSKVAIFYCCWNTSYCDYPCQQKHWPQHMHSCSQAANSSAQPAATDKGTEQSAMKMSKTTHAPVIDKIATPIPAKISVKVPRSTASTKVSVEDGLVSSSAPGVGSVAASKSTLKTIVSGPTKFPKFPPVQQSSYPPKSSGSAISAIGARLMAARQRPSSNDEMQPIVISAKISDAAIMSSSLPKSGISSLSTTDHVKVSMESPLSPDSTARSPAASLRKLSVDYANAAEIKASPTCPAKQSESKIDCSPTTTQSTSKVSPIVSKTMVSPPSSKPVSSSTTDKEPETQKVELAPAVSNVTKKADSPANESTNQVQMRPDKTLADTRHTDAGRRKDDSETRTEYDAVKATDIIPVLSQSDSHGNMPVTALAKVSSAEDKTNSEISALPATSVA